MAFKLITYRRWKKFWETAFQWFSDKFEAIASSIDFTPVNEKLDDIKEDVGDVKDAVQNIDFSELAKQGTNPNATNTDILAAFPQECSNEDIDRMFESITEEGYILIPSGLIRTNGKMSLSVFIAITGLTPVIVSNDVQEVVVTEDGYIIVPSSMISAFGTMSLRKFMQRTKLTPIY